MKNTYEQMVQDKTLELERLMAIYNQVSDYTKQLSGLTMNQLRDSIEEVSEFIDMHNMSHSDYPDEYCEWV